MYHRYLLYLIRCIFILHFPAFLLPFGSIWHIPAHGAAQVVFSVTTFKGALLVQLLGRWVNCFFCAVLRVQRGAY